MHSFNAQVIPASAWPMPGSGLAQIANRLLSSLFQLDKLFHLYDGIPRDDSSRSFVDQALNHLDINYNIVRGSLDAIPREGPLVIVANHPFGGIEGLVLLSLLATVRPDVKLMANQLLSGIPELRKDMILVDPFGGSEAAAKNTAPVRQSLRWLKNGGALALFPAGEVAHFDLARKRICESDWHETAARLVRHSGAAVIPVFFAGANGPLFQMAGLIHPRLRTAMLVREMVNKTGHSLKVSIGHALPFEKVNTIRDDAELTHYLRMRVQLLGANRKVAPKQLTGKPFARKVPLVSAKSPNNIALEVAWLKPEQKLLEVGDYRVYIAQANQIPCVTHEIARLREVTFRAAGEGTGQPLDIDVFDSFYHHLFVWNVKTSAVIGAYRLGLTDTILPEYGLGGLYTSTLFKYEWDLIDQMSPAIEIGRSFIRPEYQRKHLPLLLLWKGIGIYVAMNPKYRNLFGTVSMSNSYAEASRQLVARFFEQKKTCAHSPQSVTPRNPFRFKDIPGADASGPICRIPDLGALSEMVSEIEADGKGIPVLIRQYMKMGGRILACNVDPKFNMTLDALIVVDLAHTDPRLLEVYMGELTAGYLNHHGVAGREERQAQCA